VLIAAVTQISFSKIDLKYVHLLVSTGMQDMLQTTRKWVFF